jgi:hypothetical protein
VADILGLDHVQLAMPAGQEDVARGFYVGVLGLSEETKPANLQIRGGVWFRGGALRLHLGVEQEFRPARKAHPGFSSADWESSKRAVRLPVSPRSETSSWKASTAAMSPIRSAIESSFSNVDSSEATERRSLRASALGRAKLSA